MRELKTVTKHTSVKVVISAEDIRKAFNLPKDAIVFVDVPGGGDWSNTALVLDRDSQLEASYTTSEQVK